MSIEKDIPPQVRHARIEGNREALSAMGKKGNRKSADARALNNALRREHEEQNLKDMQTNADQRRDDLIEDL